MKTILFDASVHFGQFCVGNEKLRISCKNSQACISPNKNSDVQGLYTYFENGWMDDTIWHLKRDIQDVYYPFMDVFFSNDNITGLADNVEEMSFATMLATKFPGMTSSGAITCALAVSRRADEVHTLYNSLLNPKLVAYMKEQYGVSIGLPTASKELSFKTDAKHLDLEKLYDAAYAVFKKSGTDLMARLHDKVSL